MKKLVYLIVSVLELILISSCGSKDERESKLRDYFQQRVTSESQEALKLENFNKKNGYDQEIKGMKVYVLEWQADISAQQEIWKSGNAFIGYWENFNVMTKQPGYLEEMSKASGSKHFNLGEKIRLTGDSYLQKTEQGWRVIELRVKTSQILSDSDASNSSNTSENPSAPASMKALQDELKGKNYKVQKAGTHSLISTDKDITWLEPKENNKFEKEIVDESKSLQMNFVNDTSIIVQMKGKTYNGTYIVDTVTKEDEKTGIKLRVSYVDEDFKFGDGPASRVTYTYLVEGINDKSILLETPRSMNSRKIVVLMNKQ